jgi:mycofactocin precursor
MDQHRIDEHPDDNRFEAPTGHDVEPAAEAVLVEADVLIEDVSIDGMCGVY